MNIEKLYKTLILVLILIQLLWFFIPWQFAYPDESINALMWLGANSIIESRNFIVIYSVGIVALYILSYIGLLFYIPTAKTLYCILVLGSGFAGPFLGLSVQSGYESLLGYYITIGDGIVLCMILFTSIALKFNHHNEQA